VLSVDLKCSKCIHADVIMLSAPLSPVSRFLSDMVMHLHMQHPFHLLPGNAFACSRAPFFPSQHHNCAVRCSGLQAFQLFLTHWAHTQKSSCGHAACSEWFAGVPVDPYSLGAYKTTVLSGAVVCRRSSCSSLTGRIQKSLPLDMLHAQSGLQAFQLFLTHWARTKQVCFQVQWFAGVSGVPHSLGAYKKVFLWTSCMLRVVCRRSSCSLLTGHMQNNCAFRCSGLQAFQVFLTHWAHTQKSSCGHAACSEWCARVSVDRRRESMTIPERKNSCYYLV